MKSSIIEIIFENARTAPDFVCLADAEREVTNAEFKAEIESRAAALRELGVENGCRVALRASQSIGFLAALHGIQLAGGVAVPVEKGCSEARLIEITEKTSAIALTDGDILREKAVSKTFPLPRPGDSSLILFTTGTTGASKGIELTHSADVAAAENVKFAVEMKPGNVELLPMPLNHSFALRRYFASMLGGGRVVLLDGLMQMKLFFEAMESATSLALSPAALPLIFALSGERLGDFADRLDYVQFGSAPFPESEKERLRRLLPHSRLYNIYGSTEAGVACAYDFSRGDIPHCIGRPTKNSFIKLTPEGTLAVGGGMVMKGYWGEPELTRETLKDGFVITSDLGRVDENGLVYMLGRSTDVISWGGYKIAPSEVEEAAADFPGLRCCACAAVQDGLAGECAALFYESAFPLDERALAAHMSKKLEPYKLPKIFKRLPALPRTYNGKLDRKTLGGLGKC